MEQSRLSAYLPVDRFLALGQNSPLPERATGVALFADIFGFTPLTETLLNALGPRQGSESLTHYLNLAYDTLINQVHAYHGSVIFFSGDAITCWFDVLQGEELAEAAARATSVALAMQAEMPKLAQIEIPPGQCLNLSLKVAVVAGPVRRFVAGNPAVQRLDILAGATLERLAQAEHIAWKGEVVVGPEVIELLENAAYRPVISVYRTVDPAQPPYGVLVGLTRMAEAKPWSKVSEDELVPASWLQEWLLPPVYKRISAGLGNFLAELRPVTALFLSFEGLDYDRDEAAGERLDEFIREVQALVNQYEGSLLQVTLGDKGSYLYCTFGALLAHQNDCERALRVGQLLLALPSRRDWVRNLRIGISQGTMRCGAYGGTTRHTYGVLGHEVNLSARLMQAAEPGQVLVSSRIYKETAAKSGLKWQALPPLKVKGKDAPIHVYQLLECGEPRQNLKLSNDATPLVGRAEELALVRQKLSEVQTGQGHFIRLNGDAGIGKSRLLAEITRLTTKEFSFATLYGECHSYATNSPYHAWQPIFREFFGLDTAQSLSRQINHLADALARLDNEFVSRLPLLGMALGLPIPDNALTASFDPKLRKTSLESLLVDCLKIRFHKTPLLLVLEDCHWLDALSQDLLQLVSQVIFDLPVLVVATYRPQEPNHPGVSGFPSSTELRLTPLTSEEARQLLTLKTGPASLPNEQLDPVIARAEGNPFYLEELLNYLHDNENKAALELPDSLHTLVLSRLDNLEEGSKAVLKVASVIGREFAAEWVWQAYPPVGQPEQVKGYLRQLDRQNLTLLRKPEPELEYLFNHAITQEVIYESQPLGERRRLHELVGDYIEWAYREQSDQYIDLLAYHYGNSSNRTKQCEYYRKAAKQASLRYANSIALEYYRKLLALLDEEQEHLKIWLEMAQILILVGNYVEAEAAALKALELAGKCEDSFAQVRSQQYIGHIKQRQGDYRAAIKWLGLAHAGWEALLAGETGSRLEMARSGRLESASLICKVLANQGEYHKMQEMAQEMLQLARRWNDKPGIAINLSALGAVAYYRGEYEQAERFYQESLVSQHGISNKPALARDLNSLALVYYSWGNYEQAERYYQESLAILREIGDGPATAGIVINLGFLALNKGEYDVAAEYYRESLAFFRLMGDKRGTGIGLNNLAKVALYQGQYVEAERLCQESLGIRTEIGDRFGLAYCLNTLGWIQYRRGNNEAALRSFQESLALAKETGVKQILILNLVGLVAIALNLGENYEVKDNLASLSEVEQVARLLGLLENLISRQNSGLEPLERGMYTRAQAIIQPHLYDPIIKVAFEEGKELSPEQVVNFALEKTKNFATSPARS